VIIMRRRLVGGLLVLPAMLGLALAGCGKSGGDGGVATAGGSAKPSASAANADLSDADRQLKFTQCMRDNGIDMPDPDPANAGKIQLGPDADPQKVKAAMDKCRQYMPGGGRAPKLDPGQAEQMRKFSQCMRDNGIPNFPDPQPDGTMQIDIGALGIKDRDDPTLKAAQEKCQQYSPKMTGALGGGGK
jgi:hypothetical protein